MRIWNLDRCSRSRHAQEFTRKRNLLLAPVIGNQPKVADPVEAAR
jgi:hypothetical protein